MFALTESTPVVLFREPCDMRKGFYALARIAEGYVGRTLQQGGLFVFISRSRDRVKLLYWHEDGYCLWYKRLEVGTFRIEERCGVDEITGVDLTLLLSGMSLNRILFRKNQQQSLHAA